MKMEEPKTVYEATHLSQSPADQMLHAEGYVNKAKEYADDGHLIEVRYESNWFPLYGEDDGYNECVKNRIRCRVHGLRFRKFEDHDLERERECFSRHPDFTHKEILALAAFIQEVPR